VIPFVLSLIEEHWERKVRMANLCIVASHSVNGVAALHSEILKEDLFRDFYEMYPERFNNKTNGITQRRWLKKSNIRLSSLISEKLGEGWVTDLFELQQLIPLAENADFVTRWQEVKKANKEHLASYIAKHNCIKVNVDSLFDCQVKRIHEYKRQLLNILHVITLYNRIKENPDIDIVPRTFIFSGKAAPSYFTAKLIINLINCVGHVINNDLDVRDRLKVVFLANYSVSLAEKIFPAADLSEQISTAGTEASGTGNMKFALNGSLTIGTLDGANVEMMEEIGRENMFIFGLTTPEVNDLRQRGYNPKEFYNRNPELKQTLDMIGNGAFSKGDTDQFKPILDLLLNQGDYYMLLADYESYVACQDKVSVLYRDKKAWARMAIINTASMGKFSSDRTIAEYAEEIWDVTTLAVEATVQHCLHEGLCLDHKSHPQLSE